MMSKIHLSLPNAYKLMCFDRNVNGNRDVKFLTSLTFNSKSSQIAKIFLRPFSQAFGLAYSPLNSATLSCSSEVTLLTLFYLLIYASFLWVARKEGTRTTQGAHWSLGLYHNNNTRYGNLYFHQVAVHQAFQILYTNRLNYSLI